MTTNETATQWNDVISLYIIITISSLSAIICTLACLIIIILTYITPSLHSPTNLLVSNTCCCTLFNLIISTMNSFIFYTQTTSTNWSCRIRGYLYYVSISLVIYSYIIQAISRLFWTVLYRYRYLLTMKCHIYLIISQIFLSFILPLSSIITTDIVFRPFKLCLVAMKYKIHVLYLLTIAILYTIIYYHIARSTANFQRTLHGAKRDSELARNILILLSIFVFGGIPIVIYIIVSNEIESVPTIFYLIVITVPSIAVAVEKTMTIVLNKDIRKTLKLRWITSFPNCRLSTTHVNNTHRRTLRTVSGMIHTVNIRISPLKTSNLPNIQI